MVRIPCKRVYVKIRNLSEWETGRKGERVGLAVFCDKNSGGEKTNNSLIIP